MSKAAELAAFIANQSSANVASKNIIINGDMSVAQRNTTSTSSGVNVVDRFGVGFAQVSITQSQQSLTSGSPYEAGFQKFIRMANTSTSSNASSYIQLNHSIEARNIAKSGWNFKSSSSFMTVSFWARSSLAGTYYARINTDDGTAYYRIKAFTLSADTWTKVSFTFEGNSNLTINNDKGIGLQVVIVPHYGTTYTGTNASTTAWFTLTSNEYFPDYAQNWGNTSSATFDVTGMQLEVGEIATPFKHEDFGDNLVRCQRYFQTIGYDPEDTPGTSGNYNGAIETANPSSVYFYGHQRFPVIMRAAPTVTLYAMPAGGTETSGITIDWNSGSTLGSTSVARINSVGYGYLTAGSSASTGAVYKALLDAEL